jgi:transcriptional regulator with XRE-family HTH domain
MIGKTLKLHRGNKNISQQKIAELLGISQKTYSNIETNKTEASIKQLSIISEVLAFDLLGEFERQGISFHREKKEISKEAGGYCTLPLQLKLSHDALVNQLKEEILFLRNLLNSKK